MFRLPGVAIIIWSLIVLPLYAGAPASSVNESMGVASATALVIKLSNDIDRLQGHNTRHIVQKISKSACHDFDAAKLAANDSCANCIAEYMSSNMCGTSCVLGGIAINYATKSLPAGQSTRPSIEKSESLYSGFFDRIYYPPRLS